MFFESENISLEGTLAVFDEVDYIDPGLMIILDHI